MSYLCRFLFACFFVFNFIPCLMHFYTIIIPILSDRTMVDLVYICSGCPQYSKLPMPLYITAPSVMQTYRKITAMTIDLMERAVQF